MVPSATPDDPYIPVHEVRDYQRINALVTQLLDRGHSRVRLIGVSSQRLLLSGLRGNWRAVIEVEGPAGPELASNLNAPSLIVVARGFVADGAASGLMAGRLVIQGDSGDALAYGQAGGAVLACGSVGHRAGLQMRDGLLFLGGPAGRLLGEWQRGGQIIARNPNIGRNVGHGRTGGRLLLSHEFVGPDQDPFVSATLRELQPYLSHPIHQDG